MQNKPVEFFSKEKKKIDQTEICAGKSHTTNTEMLKSILLSCSKIVKEKKSTLAQDISQELGKEGAKKIGSVPVWNNTIILRINELNNNVNDQLIEAVCVGQLFALELDESSDVSNLAQLMVYIHLVLELLFHK